MAEKRILIVDDDPDLVEAVSMLLEAENMVPLAAYGGIEGLEKAKTENPDLIILDVMMPDMDGLDLAKEMAADDKLSRIPLVMLSAVVESMSETTYAPHAAARELEAEEWFDKPVDPQALVNRVKELLD